MNAFAAASGGALIVLLGLAWVIGRNSGNGHLGILIDERGRYSLTHFQIVLWTIVILSSAIGVLISQGFKPESLQFPPVLLGLMGISAGSAVLATGVKGVKDAPGSGAMIARAWAGTTSAGRAVAAYPAHLAQIWLEEEGEQADKVINITKFQNFIFTLVIVAIYVSLALKAGGFPTLPENIVWLIGISNAGYVGGKIPGKS